MSNLLFYRFCITNTLLGCLAGALWLQGYVWPVIEGGAPLTYGILALFGVGWVSCLAGCINVGHDLNLAKLYGHEVASSYEADKAGLKTEWLDNIGQWLVGLGLLGTVIGFSIALSGIDQGAVADASGAQGAVAQLMNGMKVALNTTLLGASLAIWHEINMRMLRTAMGCLWLDRVRAGRGEITARGVD